MTASDTRTEDRSDLDTDDTVRHLFDPHSPELPEAGEVGTALCGARARRRPAIQWIPPGPSSLSPEHCPLCALIHAEG